MNEFTAIVLAAGKGTRMKSSAPKVLRLIWGRPLIYYVLKELLALPGRIRQIIIVVGYKGKEVEAAVREFLREHPHKHCKVEFVYQTPQLGTGHAVSVARTKAAYDNILVTCGDAPLVTRQTLTEFISSFLRKKLSCYILTAYLEPKNTPGAIVRDGAGKPKGIAEKAGMIDGWRGRGAKEEANSGIYCFRRKELFEHLAKVEKNKHKGEYFLTDTVELFYRHGQPLDAYVLDDPKQILGINTMSDLWEAQEVIRRRLLEALTQRGVEIVDPATTYIFEGVTIGKNTIIYPFTFVEKDVIIGSNCALGPFLRIRSGTAIGDHTHVGNFLEINRSKLGKNVKAKHFSYLGDVRVGDNANIGAGTVVANYDGKHKHPSTIGAGAFIGSDTVLVAPLTVGQGAATGAGSVVTKNVAAKTIVVGAPARFFKKRK